MVASIEQTQFDFPAGTLCWNSIESATGTMSSARPWKMRVGFCPAARAPERKQVLFFNEAIANLGIDMFVLVADVTCLLPVVSFQHCQ